MDPNATWDELLHSLVEHEWDRVDELAHTLLRWMDHGGFPPHSVTSADVGPQWDRALVRAGCRYAVRLARKKVRKQPRSSHEEEDIP